MEVKDLKWYSPFVYFVGAILSFADPITDILTLVEFYRSDHKTWFGVGLIFVLLPCLAFPVLFVRLRAQLTASPSNWAKTALCALHPFSAAFARVEAFIFCLKKWWYIDGIDPKSLNEAEGLLTHNDLALLFEAVLESAPQFIIQLYAISVQQESAAIIQIISLPISFLALAWAFTATDKTSLAVNNIIPSSGDLNVKHQLALFVTHLLLLSSRLFAICYFTVSYKWWVTAMLMFHFCAVVTETFIQNRDKVGRNAPYVLLIMFFVGIHFLRDDFVEFSIGVNVTGLTMSVFLSHILFVLENFFMILMFYLTYHPNTWYSLPVTVCVCVFSVLGSTIRICLLHWLRNKPTGGLSAANSSCQSTSEVEHFFTIRYEREDAGCVHDCEEPWCDNV